MCEARSHRARPFCDINEVPCEHRLSIDNLPYRRRVRPAPRGGSMSKSFRCFCACACIFLLPALPAFGASITSTWIDGNSNWNLASHWNNVPAFVGVPNNGGGNTFSAVLSDGSSVTMDISVTINNLTIDSVDSLLVNNGLAFTMNSGAG